MLSPPLFVFALAQKQTRKRRNYLAAELPELVEGQANMHQTMVKKA